MGLPKPAASRAPAETLNLSQSAISRQISALEEDVGTPLFHRHARGLVLTEQGELLLESAKTIASKIADDVQSPKREQGRAVGTIFG